jgi:RsiW-degrading membrane proteinase PrsW (M82 family)
MSTVFAQVDNRTISDGWLVLLFFIRIFLGFLPAIIAWVRHHPKRWWIYLLTILAGGGSFGWPPQLLGRIYFALNGPLNVGDQLYAAPLPMDVADWVLIVWSDYLVARNVLGDSQD